MYFTSHPCGCWIFFLEEAVKYKPETYSNILPSDTTVCLYALGLSFRKMLSSNSLNRYNMYKLSPPMQTSKMVGI